MSLCGHSAVDERGDVWMVEVRENLAFAPKTSEREIGFEAGLDDLDRDAFTVLIVRTCGFVHGPHSAATDKPYDVVRADAPSCREQWTVSRGKINSSQRCAKAIVRDVRDGDQRFDLAPEAEIRFDALEICRAIRRRLIHRRIEQLA